MSTRIGVAVSASAVRAVVVRDGSVTWWGGESRGSDRPLGDVLASVLAEALDAAPSRRWSRPEVRVALGPDAVQLKLLRGLPAAEDTLLLTRVVQESRRSFFLANGSPLVTGSVRVMAAGEAWAAAFEEPVIEVVRKTFQALSVQDGAILPSAVALPFAAENHHFVWREGAIGLEIGSSPSGLEEMRRRPCVAMNGELPELEPVPALAELGEGARDLAAAYGAAVLEDEEWVGVGVPTNPEGSSRSWRRRLLAPGAVVTLAILLALAAPVRSAILAGQAETALREFHSGERWEMVGLTLDRLAEISGVLDEIESFASTRTEVTTLLGALAEGLPDDAALLRFRLEGDEGEVVARTTVAADLLNVLRGLPSLEWVENGALAAGQGPGSAQVEQVTIRFRVVRSDPQWGGRP
jgi:hypothetical protein